MMQETASELAREREQRQPSPVHLAVRLELPDRPPREFSYDFRQAEISLGRDPSNDIQVPLTTVSRRHARIFFELGDYFLEDLGSTHGTEHNGRQIASNEKRLLRDGDTISIMSFSITFKTTAGTVLDRQPGEKTEQLARRMVQEVLSTLGASKMDPPALRVMNGPDEGQRFDIGEEAAEVTIGRSPECDLPLNDQNISRRHCLIKRNWHGFTAQDLGSKNGVLVNGTRIEGAHNIKDGDEIQIGGVKLIFIDPPSRLLDQFGGIDSHIGAAAPGGEVAPNADIHGETEPPPSRPMNASAPGDLAPLVETADLGDGPASLPVRDPELLKQVNAELAQVAKKGIGWEFLVLALGGVVLAAAVGLVVFLVM